MGRALGALAALALAAATSGRASADAAPPAKGAPSPRRWVQACEARLKLLADQLKATHPKLIALPTSRPIAADSTVVSVALADGAWQAAIAVDDAGNTPVFATGEARWQAGPMRFSLRYPQAGAPKGDLSNDQLFRAALGCASSGFAFSARDLAGRAGRVVVLQATYRATPVLTQGKAPPGRPRDHALLELGDGTRVLVEPYGSSEGVRDAKELALDGAVVHATGVWRSGPTGELQSPMNPALEHAVVIPIR